LPFKNSEFIFSISGNKIAVIENLGATQDQYDCIDLSDNEINKLENFPLLNRLRTLLVSNNHVNRISSLGESLPHLDTIILNNNKISNLSDIDPLEELPNLKTLSLIDNPIIKKQNYRLYVIHKLPKLTLLDFRKIKQKERISSKNLFGIAEKGKSKTKSKDKEEEEEPFIHPSGFSKHQVESIKTAIQNATSMEEVAELERSLASGQLPNEDFKMQT